MIQDAALANSQVAPSAQIPPRSGSGSFTDLSAQDKTVQTTAAVTAAAAMAAMATIATEASSAERCEPNSVPNYATTSTGDSQATVPVLAAVSVNRGGLSPNSTNENGQAASVANQTPDQTPAPDQAQTPTQTSRVQSKASEILEVGECKFTRIPLDSLQPGDIFCTYESTSTIPSIIEAVEFQRMISGSKGKNQHKLLHFGIILEKHKREGVYEIAHASGYQKKVVKETENLKHYAPGQSIVVFRTENAAIRGKIVDIAKDTSTRGNPWAIRLQDPNLSTLKKLKLLFQTILFEKKSKSHPTPLQFKEVSRLAVEQHEGKGFLDEEGKPRTFNCAEYVACVINTAIIQSATSSVLGDNKKTTDKNLRATEKTTDEKVEIISESLEKMHGKVKLAAPISYVTPEVSSKSLIEFLSEQSDFWKPVGFVGTHKDEWNEDDLLRPRQGVRLVDTAQLQKMKKLFGELDEKQLLQAFRTADLIDGKNYLLTDHLEHQEKRASAFAILYAKQRGLTLEQAKEFILDYKNKEAITELAKFRRAFCDFQKQELQKLLVDTRLDDINKKYPTRSKEELQGCISEGIAYFSEPESFAQELSQQTGIPLTEIKAFMPKIDEETFINQWATAKNLKPEFVKKYKEWKNRAEFFNMERAFATFETELKNLSTEKLSERKAALPSKTAVSLEDWKVVLELEKELIKDFRPFDLPDVQERTKRIAINAIRRKRVQALEKKSFGERLITYGYYTLPLLPVGLALLAVGHFYKQLGENLDKEGICWENRIAKVYEQAAPNTIMSLKSNVGPDARPWIHYSEDGGTTWKDEPLWLRSGNDKWEVGLKLQADGITYKYYIGSSDPKCTDPLASAKAWMETSDGNNIVVNKEQFIPVRVGSLKAAPKVENPNWR
jgi:hypothetical protein